MALQVTANVAKRKQVFLGEEAALGKYGVEGGRAVALGEHEAIAIGAARVGRVDIHLLEIQVGHDLRSSKRAAGMSRLRRMDTGDDSLPHFVGKVLELFIAHGAFLSHVVSSVTNTSAPP